MANDGPKSRPPAPRVKGRLDELALESRYLARCGSCGQFLWTVHDGQNLVPSWLNDLRAGWRFDLNDRIWRPTETHLAQRAAASARVESGTATPHDRILLRVSGFGRRRSRDSRDEQGRIREGRSSGHFAGARFPAAPPEASHFGATAELPVAIQCPRCGAENDLDDPNPPTG